MELRLRKVKKEDLVLIMNWRMEKEVTKYMFTDPILTYDVQIRWFDKISKEDNSYYWIIQINGTDVGLISLSNIDFSSKKCNLGYYIARLDYRGLSVTRSILLNVYIFAFNELKLEKIISEVLESNDRAIKIYQKFGFKKEKTLEKFTRKNEEYLNVVYMMMYRDSLNDVIQKYKFEDVSIEI